MLGPNSPIGGGWEIFVDTVEVDEMFIDPAYYWFAALIQWECYTMEGTTP